MRSPDGSVVIDQVFNSYQRSMGIDHLEVKSHDLRQIQIASPGKDVQSNGPGIERSAIVFVWIHNCQWCVVLSLFETTGTVQSVVSTAAATV